MSIASFSKVFKRHETAVGTSSEDKIVHIAAGGSHSMILTEHGCIYSFGYGAHGQLGIGVVQNKNKPSLVKSFLPPAVMGFNEVEE